MYHPGKVIETLKKTDKEVISADETMQAVLEMWDENILTLLVNSKLSAKLKAGQVVIVDYRPDEKHSAPVPRHEVVKIVLGKKATKIWDVYKDMHEKKRRKTGAAVQQKNPAQSYIG